MMVLLWLNSLLAISAGIAALLALFRPALMLRAAQVTEGEIFYARMYAARAIPAALLTLLAPWLWQGESVSAILLAAAFMQLGDAWIGWRKREWGMVMAPSCAAVIHFLTSFVVL